MQRPSTRQVRTLKKFKGGGMEEKKDRRKLKWTINK